MFVETVGLIRLFMSELGRCGERARHKFHHARIDERDWMGHAEKIDPEGFPAWRAAREARELVDGIQSDPERGSAPPEDFRL